ncbi:hypothetical protein Tsubulata_004208 [Turnera subulata]|uniref:RNA polymerase subunit H/Rpb5 C-terminal domain-containing protein n=1 Tax=Turnera subulata TaxID=218843 RepID=A0A9Q0FT23_9ROSI|nr:hypothetical protein Tsubulata_004208 [Turnera subulata]
MEQQQNNGGGGGGGGENGSLLEMESTGRCLTSFVVEEGSRDCHRYYLSRRTALEMLKDRGFSVPSSEMHLSFQQFRATFSDSPDVDRLTFSATHSSHPSKGDSLSGLILVVHSNFSKPARTALEGFSFKVEIFQITDLLVDITKHVINPRHQILSNKEKQRLLEKHNIEDKQLPRLSKDDAIARYYGLQKGQVVKFMYDGDITGSFVSYRCIS